MTTEEFKAKILPHYKYMYRIAASVMNNDTEAADIVQDAVLRLYERRKRLDNVADIKSYCSYVVRNACLNIIRDRKNLVNTEKLLDKESDEDIHMEIEWHDMSGMIDRIVDRLPANQSNVFKLSAFGGFSNAEIAEMLGISQGNVRTILSRARHMIRKYLFK